MSYIAAEKKTQMKKSAKKPWSGGKTGRNVVRQPEIPVYVLENSREKHAWEEKMQKNMGRERGQQANFQISSGIVQMMRKRVYRATEEETAEVSPEDIFYDDTDGKYYTGMEKENVGERQKAVDKDIIKYEERDKNENILYLVDIGDKFVKYENVECVNEEVEGERKAVYYNKKNIYVYTKGNEYNLIAVRLYAEGNMRHAQELAKGFLDDPFLENGELSRYQKLLGLAEGSNQADAAARIAEKIIIKATEFRTIEDVSDVYQEVAVGQGLSMKNLETYFGKKTGDMTRKRESNEEKANKPNRQYDLIQATFFWLPGSISRESFNKLKEFYINRYDDLKENGRIRATLSKEAFPKRNQSLEQTNCYSFVAAELEGDEELKTIYDMKKYELKEQDGTLQKYSDALIGIGLNHEDGFKHTQTDRNDKVNSIGDIIVEGIKKSRSPQVNTQGTGEEEQEQMIQDKDSVPAEKAPESDDTQSYDNEMSDEGVTTDEKVNAEDIKSEAEQIIDKTPDMAKLPPARKSSIASKVVEMLALAASAAVNKILVDYFHSGFKW